METNFNFKSQICTTRKQSERLLALGLKPETADMVHYISASMKEWGILATPWRDDYEGCKFYSPAWSLHRLIEMIQDAIVNKDGTDDNLMLDISGIGLYDGTIDAIAELIKVGYFNKEYLEE